MSALIRKSGQSHQRFLSARLVVETNQRHKRPSIQGYMLDLDWHEDVTAPRTDPNIAMHLETLGKSIPSSPLQLSKFDLQNANHMSGFLDD